MRLKWLSEQGAVLDLVPPEQPDKALFDERKPQAADCYRHRRFHTFTMGEGDRSGLPAHHT